MKAHPLEKLARTMMRVAREWRKTAAPSNVFAQGVIRGLHEAALLCRLQVASDARKLKRG